MVLSNFYFIAGGGMAVYVILLLLSLFVPEILFNIIVDRKFRKENVKALAIPLGILSLLAIIFSNGVILFYNEFNALCIRIYILTDSIIIVWVIIIVLDFWSKQRRSKPTKIKIHPQKSEIRTKLEKLYEWFMQVYIDV